MKHAARCSPRPVDDARLHSPLLFAGASLKPVFLGKSNAEKSD